MCQAPFGGANDVEETECLQGTEGLSPAPCVPVRVPLCTRIRGAPRALPRQLWLPATRSTPRRLPSSGVLSCSVSQPRRAPSRTMSCVTFEQTHVRSRGASQTSTGNSTMRTYILILAPASWSVHVNTHTHTHPYLPLQEVDLFFPFSRTSP